MKDTWLNRYEIKAYETWLDTNEIKPYEKEIETYEIKAKETKRATNKQQTRAQIFFSLRKKKRKIVKGKVSGIISINIPLI